MTECYFIPINNTSSVTICANCGKEKMLHTIGSGVKEVSIYLVNGSEEHKQETLEEVAQWVIDNRYAKSELEKVSDFEMYNTIIDKCSKWQQERSYSEEEVLDILFKHTEYFNGYGKRMTLTEWFNNLKKK